MAADRKDFTPKFLESLKPKPQRYAVSDLTCPALKVRVTPNGKKVFILWKRFPGQLSPSARSLGEVGILPLAEARETARGWVNLIKQGKDPREIEAAQRAAEAERVVAEAAERAAKAELTFGKIVRTRYFAHITHQRKAKDVQNEFEHDLLPLWENKPVQEITRKDIRVRVRAIALRTTSQAHSAITNLRAFFNWWRDENDLEIVPTDGMKSDKVVGRKKQHRRRVLTDDEIFAYWRATRPERWTAFTARPLRRIRGKMQRVAVFHPDRAATVAACRVLLLSGARLNEICEADRRELNPQGSVLTVPPERYKSGESHMIFLSIQAQEIISSLPKRNKTTFLFTDHGEGTVQISTKDRDRIDRRMLLTLKALARIRGENPSAVKLERFVFHDLRRTVRTRLSQLKVTHEVREMILGHGKKGLDRVYDQYEFQDEMRDGLERWAALLFTIVNSPPKDNVIRIARARPVQPGNDQARVAAN